MLFHSVLSFVNFQDVDCSIDKYAVFDSVIPDLPVHKVVNHVIIVFGTKVVFAFQSLSNQRVGRAIYLHAF